MMTDLVKKIGLIRLINQQLSIRKFDTPVEAVSWMGAIQAQDFGMSKWAVATRLDNNNGNRNIEEALNKGEILRTHILRPTWHLVDAKDIRWMLKLTTPRLMATVLKTYDKILGISPDTFSKARLVIVKALEQYGHLTRQELKTHIEKAGIHTANNWLAHFVMHAEFDGFVCNGKIRGKQQTYRLIDEICPKLDCFDKDEAIEKLARRYFSSHAPASILDFSWWSSLTITEVKRGLEMIKKDFELIQIDGITYVFPLNWSSYDLNRNIINLIPAFDEYLVSYKNRNHVLPDEHYDKVIQGKNGMFKPAIAVNGNIVGTWQKIVKDKKTTVQTELFEPLDESLRTILNDEIEKFELFYQ